MLLHLAAQVAVTTSYTNPREDFEINALGTFNVMEAVRLHSPGSFVLYASTNKVYGGMETVPVELTPHGYRFRDLPDGVREDQPLDFHSPYGCSKGVADQYTDRLRPHLRPAHLRLPPVLHLRHPPVRHRGPGLGGLVQHRRPAGAPDHPLRRRLADQGRAGRARPGPGLRGRLGASRQHQRSRPSTSAAARSTPSACGICSASWRRSWTITITPRSGQSRPGDQPVFICDVRKAADRLGWAPQIHVNDGVRHLIRWVRDNRDLFGWLKP